MRLVQTPRTHRPDRVPPHRSPPALRCPRLALDHLLNLEQRLRRKQSRRQRPTVGVGKILPDQTSTDINFTETREEIERLRNSDASLFERGEPSAGHYRAKNTPTATQALKNADLARQIQELPWDQAPAWQPTPRMGPGMCSACG